MDKNWKFKVIMTALLSLYLVLYTIPTFVSVPSWYQTMITGNKLKLGLDLKGGLSLVYQVEVDDAIVSKLDMIADDINSKLEKNKIETTEVAHTVDGTDEVTYVLKDNKKAEDAKEFALATNSALVFKGNEGNRYTFKLGKKEVLNLKKDAVNKAIDTIRRRINTMGIGEQEVVRFGDESMYSVEVRLPGLKEEDFNKTKRIISKTAQLEFKVVDDNDPDKNGVRANVMQGLIDTHKDKMPERITSVSTAYSIEKTGEQVPDLYFRTPDVNEPNPTKRTEILKADLTKLEEFVKTLKVPFVNKIAIEEDRRGNTYHYRTYLLKKKTVLTGEYIAEAQSLVNPQDNSPYVGLRFTTIGSEIFAKLTEENKHRRMAIVLDNMVDSAPTIQEKIAGGNASISLGSGSYQEKVRKAEELKLLLKAGSLPASLTKGEERRVGATLGEASIKAGQFSILIGFAFVLLFMLFYYRKAGLIANVALTLNIFFILAVMIFLGAAMTLPGIAGIVLTVGMSVDANVIIYERIREEVDGGRLPISAVKYGYEKAFSAIIDANITTMIAAFILYQYGSGPVQGFAVTLIVGILSSMFTAIVVTRMFFDHATVNKKIEKLSI